ncbi:MAG: hypothetical protein JO147_13370 [Actinobacteria bacterium]|nr:hypothetical protein [Actinomycetota bacterium]
MGARDFDPVVVGRRECQAWAAYYRHEWATFLAGAVGMVRAGFGLPWPRTLLGAWYVLRANQVWAPYPDNDPDAARAFMTKFYGQVRTVGDVDLDPVEAARREVEWWRVHRLHQRDAALSESDLSDALVSLYGYVYAVDEARVREAADQRVLAMRYSDEWVEAGCDLADQRLAHERLALVASYTALRKAVERL